MNILSAEECIYGELDKKILTDAEITKPSGPTSPDALKKFLESSIPAKRFTQSNLLDDLKYKIHYLDNIEQRHKFNKSAKKKRTLTSAEKKKNELLKLKRDGQKFDDYLPLYHLWQDYMRDLLQLKEINISTGSHKQIAEQKLLKADFHGGLLKVTASKQPSVVGLQGIVAMETKMTFHVVTSDDKLKIIPKKSTNFTMEVDGHVFTIYGNQMMIKACMRAKRKWTAKISTDL